MRVLVLEASTSAAKALAYDHEKGILSVESENYGPEIDSGGVHDARGVYDVCLRLGRKAVSKAGKESVAAVACVGVWHSVVPCDGAMNPATGAYLWNFTGTGGICRRVRERTEEAREIYRRTGCMPNITYQPYALLYLQENGFDARGKFFVSQGGYNFFNLTGERLETKSIVSGMGFLNTHSLVYDEKIMDFCGVAPEQFGELGDYRDVRPLLKGPADALGIEPGVPVVPAHSDGALNQLGSGCMGAGRMTFSVGTSAAIRLSTDRPVLSDPPATWCYAGVKGWLSGAATNGACNCVNWFRETVLKSKWSFGELNEELLSDAHTPVFLPFIFGERCPGWDDARRGVFRDLSGRDGAADMFRAIAEGVLFNVYQCYRMLVHLAGEPGRIVLSGGILNSEKWTQMAADIFQRRMELSDALHDSLIGGAALALYAAGALREPEDFVCVRASVDGRAVVPRADKKERYEEKFRRYMACENMPKE